MKKKTVAGAAIGSLVLLAAIGSCGGEEDSATPAPTVTATVTATETATETATAKPKATAPAKPAAPGVGDTVKDGKFSFTVTKVKCGIPSVGGQYGTKAQGQFCKVSMTVKNHSGEPKYFFDDDQLAFDAKGNRFSTDSTAEIYDADSEMWLENINPGNSVKGNIYFDIPKGTKLVKLELHDSAFSGGVDVVLS